METRIQSLEHWRDGNGAKGAEQRLQFVEENYVKTEQIPEIVRSSMKMLREEERKDWNKWINTGLLIIAIIGIGLQIL